MSLPPTTNALDPTQRLRLLRSTRKLGALLGATPYSEDSSLQRSRSQPINSRSKLSKAPHPPPLRLDATHQQQQLLQQHNLLLLPDDIDPTRLSPNRPRAFTLPSPSPHSPDFTITPPAVARRRKMAKLVRTLGENVPPELVFGGGGGGDDGRAQLPERTSSLSCPSFASSSSTSLSAFSISSSDSSCSGFSPDNNNNNNALTLLFTSTTSRTTSSPIRRSTSKSTNTFTPTTTTPRTTSPPPPPLPSSATMPEIPTGSNSGVSTSTSNRNSLAKRRPRSRSIGSLLNISSPSSSSSAQPPQPSSPRPTPLTNPNPNHHQYHYRRRRESSAPFSNTEPIVVVSDTTTPSDSIDELNITSRLENGDATVWVDHPTIISSSSTNKGKANKNKKNKNKKDWSGRWNLRDITEVQKGLRALK